MDEKKGKILVVDDDPDILLTTRIILKKQFETVVTESDPQRLLSHIRQGDYDVVLLDMNFRMGATSGREGIGWLQKILKADPQAVVVMMTAYGDIELAVKAMKEGAVDFIVKPWENQRLLATVQNACKLGASRREIAVLKSREQLLNQEIDSQFPDIIGQSPPMLKIYELIRKVGPTDANVLILGENGTGKELVARALHRYSSRKDQIFVTIDLGALPETLFESELFGHVKGAFTDARVDRPGRFEMADGGTLFLDEIGNLSPVMQAKLLTAIQNRTVTRIGSNTEIPVDIRLISATNIPLTEMIAQKSFRKDLLYRINTVEIRVPPLRHRTEDIPLLADHFMQQAARKYNKTGMKLANDCYPKLADYPWPGNVRELQHIIERAVILCDSKKLTPADLLIDKPVLTGGVTESMHLEDVEKQVIMKAVRHHKLNITKAAHELGMARTTLYRKMKKYGL
jgi:DNA-binding NtrC family response regulator